MRRRPAAFAALALVVASSALAGTACRRTFYDRPVPALAATPEAQARLESLQVAWIAGDPAARARLRPALSELVAELDRRGDGLAPLARAYLALSWLDEGSPEAAEAAARPLVEGPAGVANDLGTLVKGAAARRLGRPREAVELLRPLVGKLIDPFARPILYGEICASFLDDGRYDDAIAYGEGWLRSASVDDKRRVQQALERLFGQVPDAVVLRLLEADTFASAEAKHSPDMLQVLNDRLEHGRLEHGRLEHGGSAGDAGASTAVDATRAETGEGGVEADAALRIPPPKFALARFDPRSIALLLPMTAPGLGAEASAVARAAAAVADPALATGLHVDGGVEAGGPLEHRLTVLDSGGSELGLARAFGEAERGGAGVVIGGLYDAESNALAALAQARRVPTVLLRRPTQPPPLAAGERQAWVAVGPSLADEVASTLAQSPKDAAVVAPWPSPGDASPAPTEPTRGRCDARAKVAGGPAFPVAEWAARKLGVVVVLGDARCARRLADEILATPGYRPLLILGPSSLELAHVPLPLARTVFGAGLLPADDGAPSALRTLWRDQGGPVGFSGGLGHDATALAAAALPGDLGYVEAAEIQMARSVTLGRLVAAKAELWTSTSAGPGAAGLVSTTPRTRAVAAGAAIAPAWL